jgi:hypothetical protein
MRYGTGQVQKPATLPNATLDKAIREAQIRKMNGGSALAVALLMISRYCRNLPLKQYLSMAIRADDIAQEQHARHD